MDAHAPSPQPPRPLVQTPASPPPAHQRPGPPEVAEALEVPEVPEVPQAQEPLSERRLTELEIKACYLEDLVESLNTLVYQQQLRLDSLTRELLRLRDQGGQDAGSPGFRSLRDEIPPHY